MVDQHEIYQRKASESITSGSPSDSGFGGSRTPFPSVEDEEGPRDTFADILEAGAAIMGLPRLSGNMRTFTSDGK